MLKTCGFLVVCLILLSCGTCVLSVAQTEWGRHKARVAQEARENAAAKERAKREDSVARYKEVLEHKRRVKEDKLRAFILKEAPALWTSYLNLQAEIVCQDRKTDDLRRTLEEFGLDPEEDADLRQIRALRDEMADALKMMQQKIENAYLASRKYEAFPSRHEYDEICRGLLRDGIREADEAKRRLTEKRRVR